MGRPQGLRSSDHRTSDGSVNVTSFGEPFLQPTLLVHDAYIRLVDADPNQQWNGRGHFFAAAGEAMRRIMIENARRKKAEKRGGNRVRIGLEFVPPQDMSRYDNALAVDEVLSQFEEEWPEKAQLVKLRLFAGFTVDEAADALGISVPTAIATGRLLEPGYIPG